MSCLGQGAGKKNCKMNTQDDQFCADCFYILVQVFTKGISLFGDATGFLKRLRSQFNSDLRYQRAHKLLSNIEELLKHERHVFEVSFVTIAYGIQLSLLSARDKLINIYCLQIGKHQELV